MMDILTLLQVAFVAVFGFTVAIGILALVAMILIEKFLGPVCSCCGDYAETTKENQNEQK